MEQDDKIIRIRGTEENTDQSLSTPGPTVTIRPVFGRTEFDWERGLRILQKHWQIAFVFTFAVVLIVTLVSFHMKDVYEPLSSLEIDQPQSEEFSLKELLSAQESGQDYLSTQVQILQSDDLALATIRTLGLDRNPEFVGLKALQKYKAEVNRQSPSATQLTALEYLALATFRKQLSVYQVRDSRLVNVKFASHDRYLATQVTNSLVDLFIDRNYRTRYESTMQASEWLQGQLGDLRRRVQQSNQALVEYQRANNIVDADEKQNLITQKVEELNHQLAQAEAERIQLETYLNMIKVGAADSVPQIRSQVLFQYLTQHLSDAQMQLAQALAIYGKNNSTVKKLQNQVRELENQLAAERQRAIKQMQADYNALRSREQLVTKALEETKADITQTNEKMIQYNVLKQEALANSELYKTLQDRLKEAGISVGLKSTNIRVVDPARVLEKATRPNRLLNILIGLIVGALGGTIVAFLKEHFDNSIRTPDDIKELTGLSSLAMLPLVSSDNGDGHRPSLPGVVAKMLAKTDAQAAGSPSAKLFMEIPRSPQAEAVRNLYTSIMLSRPGQPPRVILVASPSPGEGKTTVGLNLAAVLAERGKTCLVDADLRRAAVARSLGLSQSVGLSNVLTGSAELGGVLRPLPFSPNLYMIPGGPVPPSPGELVGSEPMQEVMRRLRKEFQFVVLDSPPVIMFADARVLSSLADGVIIVCRFGITTRQAIVRTVEMLTEVNAPVLGLVLNAIDVSAPDYRYYHYGYDTRYGSYYRSGYNYGEHAKDAGNREED